MVVNSISGMGGRENNAAPAKRAIASPQNLGTWQKGIKVKGAMKGANPMTFSWGNFPG